MKEDIRDNEELNFEDKINILAEKRREPDELQDKYEKNFENVKPLKIDPFRDEEFYKPKKTRNLYPALVDIVTNRS